MPDLIVYILIAIISSLTTLFFSNRRVANGTLKIVHEIDVGYSMEGLILSNYEIEDLAKMRKIILVPDIRTEG